MSFLVCRKVNTVAHPPLHMLLLDYLCIDSIYCTVETCIFSEVMENFLIKRVMISPPSSSSCLEIFALPQYLRIICHALKCYLQ